MANRYFVGGGTGNYNSTTNWSDTDGGASGFSVPTSADDVFLTAASGANTLTVNVASNAKTFNCTGFTGTLAGASNLTVSGNVTLGSGMTLTYSGTLILNATNRVTSNGITINGNLTLSLVGAFTTTLVDNCNVSGNFTSTGTGNKTLNGNTLYISGSISISNNMLGTTDIVLNNSSPSTMSVTGNLKNDFTINSTSDVALGNINYDTGTFSKVAGNVTHSGLFYMGASCTLDSNGIQFDDFDFDQGNLTLLSDLNITNDFEAGRLSSVCNINGFNIYVSGSFIVYNSANSILGTSVLHLIGTGTCTNGGGSIGLNININTSGTITISGNFNYRTGTLTYISGTVVTTSSTLSISISCTLNTAGMVWNNVTIVNATTITLTSNLVCTGNSILGNAGNTTTLNGSIFTIGGSLSIGGTTSLVQGTTSIVLNGTGVWSSTQSSTGNFRNNLTFNTAGVITVSGNIQYRTGVITYTAGTIITTGSTLNIRANCILDTAGMTWDGITTNFAAMSVTLNSTVQLSGAWTLGAFDLVLGGTSGFICGTLTLTTSLSAARSLTLLAGVTYLINNALTITGPTNTFRYTILSSSSGTRAIFTLNYGSPQNVGYTNATDIDSSLGQTIYSFNGVLSNTLNWSTLTYPRQSTFTYQIN